MDPLTAALNLATAIVTISTKVWDATPPDLQKQEAANWAKFCIELGSFLTSFQPEIKHPLLQVPAVGMLPTGKFVQNQQ